jgi:hypothetical protein
MRVRVLFAVAVNLHFVVFRFILLLLLLLLLLILKYV